MAKSKCSECGHEHRRCDYDKESWGPCKKEAIGKVGRKDYCKDHIKEVCCICGEKATHGCEDGLGGLACGMPLCGKSKCKKKHVDLGHSGMRQVAQKITKSISGHGFYAET